MNTTKILVSLFALLSGLLATLATASAAEPRLESASFCDFYANVGIAEMDFYWDEVNTADQRARPELMLAVHIKNQNPFHARLAFAEELDAEGLACHVGGTPEFWSRSMEGDRPVWTYNSPPDRPGRFLVHVGRLQVSASEEVTSDYGFEYVTSSATWRPISKANTEIPLKTLPPPPSPSPAPPDPAPAPDDSCPTNTQEVSAVFNGYLPASTFSGPLGDGGFVYNGPEVTFTVAENITIVSPAGTFTAGQVVPPTIVFTFYCG